MAPKRVTEREDVAVAEGRSRTKRPPLFKVLLHNDNFTTMEFVVTVLVSVFNKSDAEAFAIMLRVHHEGVGVAGVYPFEIAEMKAEKVTAMARAREFPLMCSIQEE